MSRTARGESLHNLSSIQARNKFCCAALRAGRTRCHERRYDMHGARVRTALPSPAPLSEGAETLLKNLGVLEAVATDAMTRFVAATCTDESKLSVLCETPWTDRPSHGARQHILEVRRKHVNTGFSVDIGRVVSHDSKHT